MIPALSNEHNRSGGAGLAAAAAVLIGLVAGCGWRSTEEAHPPTPAHVQPDNTYVDPSECASCHAEIARTYLLTGMGRSFSTVRPAQAGHLDTVRLHHAPSQRYYTIAQREGALYQRRHQLGFDNRETNVLGLSADFAVGSGNHARTFLHQYPDGRLVELPVSWYAENGGVWAMSPGYDRAAHEDFRRVINEDCLACHNAYPRARLNDEGNGPRFSTLPEGIDCQRCHGPGRAHVDAIRNGNNELASRTIANPATLSRERQLEICMQCHLEPTSRPLPFRIRRYDRPPFSYVPGDALSVNFIYFDHAPGADEDKFEIAGAAYRLRKSACFKRSEMTCTTCHDPHDIPRGERAVRHYVAACQGCHADVHRQAMPRTEGVRAGATCLDCHMPKRRTDDAVHVSVTDHFIAPHTSVAGLLKARTELDESSKPGYRGEVVLYYPPQLPATPESELYLAVAQVQQGVNLGGGIPRLEQAIRRYQPARPEFAYELARAYAKTSNDAAVITWCEEALRRDRAYVPALKELSEAYVRRGDFDRAAAQLEKAVELRPRDAVTLADLGNIYLHQHRVDDADRILQRSLAIDALLPRANNTIGLVAIERGEGRTAERYFRAAIAVQPDLAEAQSNLGTLLAKGRNYPEAAFRFEQALLMNPGNADAHHSYGLVLALMHWDGRAIQELRRAIELQPGDPQLHLDLADVLASSGQRAEAAREYDAASRSSDAAVRDSAAAGLRSLQP